MPALFREVKDDVEGQEGAERDPLVNDDDQLGKSDDDELIDPDAIPELFGGPPQLDLPPFTDGPSIKFEVPVNCLADDNPGMELEDVPNCAWKGSIVLTDRKEGEEADEDKEADEDDKEDEDDKDGEKADEADEAEGGEAAEGDDEADEAPKPDVMDSTYDPDLMGDEPEIDTADPNLFDELPGGTATYDETSEEEEGESLEDGAMSLSWQSDTEEGGVDFVLKLKKDAWFGLGVSRDGYMVGGATRLWWGGTWCRKLTGWRLNKQCGSRAIVADWKIKPQALLYNLDGYRKDFVGVLDPGSNNIHSNNIHTPVCLHTEVSPTPVRAHSSHVS